MRHPAHVLVIEDDPASLKLVELLLGHAGYRAIAVGDGAEGLRHARSGRFDLVLCDLQVPVLDGFEILAHLLGDDRWRRVPVIAITALSMPGDRERALGAGFDGYFSKPIDPERFVADIEAFLPPDLRSTGGG